jgi:tellurite resistance protein TehA-like permease
MTRQNHRISDMTTVWLLPIVTLIVASSTGAVVAQALISPSTSHAPSTHYAALTLAVCLALVVVGITLAIMVFTIYLQRLIVHGLPPGISIFSAFLPLGPLGQAGFSFFIMGRIAKGLFPIASDGGDVTVTNPFVGQMGAQTASILYVLSWITAFALWSLATAWLLLAAMALGDTLTRVRLPFKITFWGMIFPNVSMT